MSILYLLGIIIITILIKLPYLKVPLDADFGIYGYHGLFWLRNEKMPTRDTIENHPPGRWILYAILLKYFKVSRQLFRYSGIFFILLTQISVFIFVSFSISLNVAYLATFFYGINISLPTFVWVQSNDEIEQSAFTAMALMLIALSVITVNWIFLLVGLCSFLSLFFKQSAYINTFPVAFMAIILTNFSILNILLFFIGMLPGFIITGYYFHKKGIFGDFLNIFALSIHGLRMHINNIFYGNKKIIKAKESNLNINEIDKNYIDAENKNFKFRQKVFARILYLKFFKQTAIFALFIPFSILNFNDHLIFLVITILWLVFAGFTVYLNKHIMPYHFIPLTAPLSILSGFGVVSLYTFIPNIFYFLCLMLPILALAIFIARNEIKEILKREKVAKGLMYINHPNEWLFFTICEKIGKSLNEVTTVEDQIYVWGAHYEVYLWAERSSPTWSLFCPHPKVGGYISNPFGDENRIVQKLVDNPPKYLVIAAETNGFEKISNFVDENYYRVEGKDDEVQIFRWIFADILPNEAEEAKKRKSEYLNFEKNQSLFDRKANINKIIKYEVIGNSKEIMTSLHYLWMDDRDDSFISSKLGEITLFNKIYDQSEKIYRKSLKTDSEAPEIQKLLGYALFHQQKFEEAKYIIENYISINKDVGTLEKLMEIYWFTHRRSEAKYICNLLLKKDPANIKLIAKHKQLEHFQIETFDIATNQINFVWEGSQFVHHSLALVNREQCLRLATSGVNLSLTPYEKDQFLPEGKYEILKKLENKPLHQVDIHLRHQWPPNLTPPKTGRWVIIQPWEFGYLPEEWVKVFNEKIDEMWVPSNYVKQVYLDSGIDTERVFVIPNGVDTEKFHPEVKPYQLKTKKKFKFLFVGGTIYRKGIDLLLKSYLSTFTKEDDVCLIIKDFGGKSFYKNQTFKQEIANLIQGKNNPEIEYINETLSEEDLIGLYTACDVLVHPYRGEGFGLPILEAMACGTPTIITNGGAALDFCNKRTSLFVKANKIVHKENQIGNKKLVNNPWFWEVDIQDLSVKMQYAARNPGILQKMGTFASDYTRRNWDWNIVALLTQKRIQKLIRRPIQRFQKDIDHVMQTVEEALQNNNLPQLREEFLQNYKYSKLGSALFGYILCEKNLQNREALRKYLPELEVIFNDNPLILNIIGIIYFELGNSVKSEEYLSKSLQYDGESLDTRRNYAELLLINEKYEECLNQFIEVLKKNPNDIISLIRMAELHLEVDRKEDADSYIAKILSIDPENEMALQLKSLLESNQEKDE